MILYHGSNVAVEEPQILQSDRKLDFGRGFYLTSSYEEAKRWAHLKMLRSGKGKEVVTAFQLKEENIHSLNILKFEGADTQWLKFVSNNRNEIDFADKHDIVIGPVANDRTMPVIRLYFAGIYDEEETVKRLMPQKLKDQYAFKTEKALKALKLNEVIKV